MSLDPLFVTLGLVGGSRIGSTVSGIDLIIGWHTHTFMDEPERITNAEGFSTMFTTIASLMHLQLTNLG